MSDERSSISNDTGVVTEDTSQVSAPLRTTGALSGLRFSALWISADTWAVLAALALAGLVKLHILNTVAW